jgi:hypothetical protein
VVQAAASSIALPSFEMIKMSYSKPVTKTRDARQRSTRSCCFRSPARSVLNLTHASDVELLERQ